MNRKMMAPPLFYIKALLKLCLLLAFLSACKPAQRSTAKITPSLPSDQPLSQAVTNTAASPTPVPPTPQPLAAIVNGWEISLAEYQSELAQYKVARGTDLAQVSI